MYRVLIWGKFNTIYISKICTAMERICCIHALSLDRNLIKKFIREPTRIRSLVFGRLVPFVEVLFEKLGRPDKELVIYTEKTETILTQIIFFGGGVKFCIPAPFLPQNTRFFGVAPGDFRHP